MHWRSEVRPSAGRGTVGGDEKPVGLLLQAAIRQKTAKIGVIGLGYVGLPLICTFVAAGFRTLGFDVDPEKVAKLQAGQSYIEHIPYASSANRHVAFSRPQSVVAGLNDGLIIVFGIDCCYEVPL